jgi:hypothetical protein
MTLLDEKTWEEVLIWPCFRFHRAFPRRAEREGGYEMVALDLG